MSLSGFQHSRPAGAPSYYRIAERRPLRPDLCTSRQDGFARRLQIIAFKDTQATVLEQGTKQVWKIPCVSMQGYTEAERVAEQAAYEPPPEPTTAKTPARVPARRHLHIR
jgi:hypothetical protein